MSLIPYPITVVRSDDDGSGKNIVPYASVSVLTQAGATASVYSTSGGSSLSNPFTLDVNGQKQIWVEPGIYQISIAGGPYLQTFISSATTEDFTSAEKSKLAGIAAGAQVNVPTNLSISGSGNSKTIASSTGSDVLLPISSATDAGLISAERTSKIDALPNNSELNIILDGIQSGLQEQLDNRELLANKRPNLLSPDNTNFPTTLAVASAIAAVSSGETPKGAWNAATNAPPLASGVGTAGWFYEVSVAGTTDLNGEDDWQVGDKAIFNGSSWSRIPASAVVSINGKQGTVVNEVATVSALAALNASVGDRVLTKGCLSIGDGGHGTFIASAAPVGAVNGYSCIESATAGVYFNLQPVNGCVDIRQFGIGSDLAPALLRADAYCQATKFTLTGSGTAKLATQVTIKAPHIRLKNFIIELENSFPSSPAIIYQAMSNDLNSRTDVEMAVNANAAGQISPIIPLRVRATPNAPRFDLYFDQCNSYCLNVNGNVERGRFTITANNLDTFVLIDGDSPDTNYFTLHGGQFNRIAVINDSTTNQIHIDCQGQKAAAGVPAFEINSTRFQKITGEIRALTYGTAIKYGAGSFSRTSADSLHLDLHIQSIANTGNIPVLDIPECNNIQGQATVSFSHGPVAYFGDITSADFTLTTLDNDYAGGYLVKFGDSISGLGPFGKFTIIDRGSNGAGAKAALFERAGVIDVYFDGSALPIDIASGCANDVINMSVERNYIATNVPITHNGVRANVHHRGQQLTLAITGYLTAVGAAGIPRGSNVWNVNTNGLNFFDGTVWKYATTTTTLT